MKRVVTTLIISIFLSTLGINLRAQDVDTTAYSITEVLNATPGITVEQPAELTKRLIKTDISENADAVKDANANRAGRQGGYYRVEVYADNSPNAKSTATARRRNMQARFPKYPAVLVFESPFWRVRVGTFGSRADAEAAMAEIKSAFPAYAPFLRIVRN